MRRGNASQLGGQRSGLSAPAVRGRPAAKKASSGSAPIAPALSVPPAGSADSNGSKTAVHGTRELQLQQFQHDDHGGRDRFRLQLPPGYDRKGLESDICTCKSAPSKWVDSALSWTKVPRLVPAYFPVDRDVFQQQQQQQQLVSSATQQAQQTDSSSVDYSEAALRSRHAPSCAILSMNFEEQVRRPEDSVAQPVPHAGTFFPTFVAFARIEDDSIGVPVGSDYACTDDSGSGSRSIVDDSGSSGDTSGGGGSGGSSDEYGALALQCGIPVSKFANRLAALAERPLDAVRFKLLRSLREVRNARLISQISEEKTGALTPSNAPGPSFVNKLPPATDLPAWYAALASVGAPILEIPSARLHATWRPDAAVVLRDLLDKVPNTSVNIMLDRLFEFRVPVHLADWCVKVQVDDSRKYYEKFAPVIKDSEVEGAKFRYFCELVLFQVSRGLVSAKRLWDDMIRIARANVPPDHRIFHITSDELLRQNSGSMNQLSVVGFGKSEAINLCAMLAKLALTVSELFWPLSTFRVADVADDGTILDSLRILYDDLFAVRLAVVRKLVGRPAVDFVGDVTLIGVQLLVNIRIAQRDLARCFQVLSSGKALERTNTSLIALDAEFVKSSESEETASVSARDFGEVDFVTKDLSSSDLSLARLMLRTCSSPRAQSALLMFLVRSSNNGQRTHLPREPIFNDALAPKLDCDSISCTAYGSFLQTADVDAEKFVTRLRALRWSGSCDSIMDSVRHKVFSAVVWACHWATSVESSSWQPRGRVAFDLSLEVEVSVQVLLVLADEAPAIVERGIDHFMHSLPSVSMIDDARAVMLILFLRRLASAHLFDPTSFKRLLIARGAPFLEQQVDSPFARAFLEAFPASPVQSLEEAARERIVDLLSSAKNYAAEITAIATMRKLPTSAKSWVETLVCRGVYRLVEAERTVTPLFSLASLLSRIPEFHMLSTLLLGAVRWCIGAHEVGMPCHCTRVFDLVRMYERSLSLLPGAMEWLATELLAFVRSSAPSSRCYKAARLWLTEVTPRSGIFWNNFLQEPFDSVSPSVVRADPGYRTDLPTLVEPFANVVTKRKFTVRDWLSETLSPHPARFDDNNVFRGSCARMIATALANSSTCSESLVESVSSEVLRLASDEGKLFWCSQAHGHHACSIVLQPFVAIVESDLTRADFVSDLLVELSLVPGFFHASCLVEVLLLPAFYDSEVCPTELVFLLCRKLLTHEAFRGIHGETLFSCAASALAVPVPSRTDIVSWISHLATCEHHTFTTNDLISSAGFRQLYDGLAEHSDLTAKGETSGNYIGCGCARSFSSMELHRAWQSSHPSEVHELSMPQLLIHLSNRVIAVGPMRKNLVGAAGELALWWDTRSVHTREEDFDAVLGDITDVPVDLFSSFVSDPSLRPWCRFGCEVLRERLFQAFELQQEKSAWQCALLLLAMMGAWSRSQDDPAGFRKYVVTTQERLFPIAVASKSADTKSKTIVRNHVAMAFALTLLPIVRSALDTVIEKRTVGSRGPDGMGQRIKKLVDQWGKLYIHLQKSGTPSAMPPTSSSLWAPDAAIALEIASVLGVNNLTPRQTNQSEDTAQLEWRTRQDIVCTKAQALIFSKTLPEHAYTENHRFQPAAELLSESVMSEEAKAKRISQEQHEALRKRISQQEAAHAPALKRARQ